MAIRHAQSSQAVPEGLDREPEALPPAFDGQRQPGHLGPSLTVADADRLPLVLRAADMATAFGYRSLHGFHYAERRGAFRKFEIAGTVHPKLWSGLLVKKALSGDVISRLAPVRRRSA